MKDDKSASEKEVESKKDAAKKIEEQKKHQKHVEETLKECSFKIVDKKQYSLIFNKETFVFHLPNFFEQTQIQIICDKLAYSTTPMFSGELEVEESSISTRSSVKLITHVSFLCDKKSFDLDKLNRTEQFNFGYFILVSEQKFLEQKKKVSIEEP